MPRGFPLPKAGPERYCRRCGLVLARTRRADSQWCSFTCSRMASHERNPQASLQARERSRPRARRRAQERRSLATYGRILPTIQMYKNKYRHAQRLGYRSGLEVVVAQQLKDLGVAFKYEEVTIPFTQPPKARRYTPDLLLKNGILIETKGRFENADRQKHLLVQSQHPSLDIRFVFSNSKQRISKQSKTTYADWCRTKGFQFADKRVPMEWINEGINATAKAAALAFMVTKQ